MRKFYTVFLAVIMTASLFAQVPEKMSFQAVLRNSSNGLVTTSPVGMRISILEGSATGIPVYVETQTPTTNANGLVTIEIGSGTIVSGTVEGIDWSFDTYFVKTETAITSPFTDFTITGTSQLLSVPYALYSKKAGNGFSGNYNDLSNKPTLFNGTWSGLSGKPTTVEGYGITNAMANTHVAYNITAANISNWNTSYGWGNHATAGYLTSLTEIDPVFVAWNRSSGISITSSQVSDFQTSVTNNAEMLANTAKNSYPIADANKLAAITGTNTGDQDGSETKVMAGTNVTITGAGTVANPYVVNSTADGSGTRYLGEEYDGGIVYYIYIGSDRLEHGLIVSKTESTATWSGSTLVGANRTEDGAYNTSLMPTGAGTARILVESLGAGWYLPSIDELTARAIGSTLLSKNSTYWSSTEYTAAEAYYFHFLSGAVSWYGKSLLPLVRAVRAF
jgi:hypothetical protein